MEGRERGFWQVGNASAGCSVTLPVVLDKPFPAVRFSALLNLGCTASPEVSLPSPQIAVLTPRA